MIKPGNLSQVIDKVASENTSITEFKSHIKEYLLRLELKLFTEIKDNKTGLLKWFIGSFITLALMIIGLYLKR